MTGTGAFSSSFEGVYHVLEREAREFRWLELRLQEEMARVDAMNGALRSSEHEILSLERELLAATALCREQNAEIQTLRRDSSHYIQALENERELNKELSHELSSAEHARDEHAHDYGKLTSALATVLQCSPDPAAILKQIVSLMANNETQARTLESERRSRSAHLARTRDRVRKAAGTLQIADTAT